MNVSTGAFEALTAQVAELTQMVRDLATYRAASEYRFHKGYHCGQNAARDALLGRAASTSAAARPRPSHLSVVGGGAS